MVEHMTITGEQAVSLAKLVIDPLGNGGKEPLKATKLHSWSSLVLNIVGDQRDLVVTTPLEEPFVHYVIKASGQKVRY